MINLIKIKVLWYTVKASKLSELGIESESTEYRDVWIKIQDIRIISKSDGFIRIGYSMNEEDNMITNIPFKHFLWSGYDIEKTIKDFYK